MTNEDAFYRAMLARDARFDGKFFVGVKTTGIYCRPICPARPRRENVEFFKSALSAARAGYRPCLRCRPEAAPHSPAWVGKSAVVQRALKVLAAQSTLSSNEDDFAAQFGVSARHLRRLFEDEIGLTPKQIAFSNRLDFARQLIVETDLPIATVAMNSGFESLRRFNDAFRKRFARSPSQLRKGKARSRAAEGETKLILSYRPPFDWATLLDYSRRHRIEGIETVLNETYERVFRLDGVLGSVRVHHQAARARLEVGVHSTDPKVLFPLAQKVRQMFDLGCDPLLIANAFEGHRQLQTLSKRHPGLRLPRAWDAFEGAVCTILGQLVSVEQATRLVAQLVEHYGEAVTHPRTGLPARLFPTAQTLAEASLAEVRTTAARKTSLRELARRLCEERIGMTGLEDPAEFRASLLDIPGIGPWSAEYAALRCLGDSDAFPATDLVLKTATKAFELEGLRPWRAYAAIYYWKAHALSKGVE